MLLEERILLQETPTVFKIALDGCQQHSRKSVEEVIDLSIPHHGIPRHILPLGPGPFADFRPLIIAVVLARPGTAIR